jgi:polyferredoxin
MSIDLSDRIIQPPPLKPLKLHPIRRIIQLVMGLAIVLLPITNGLRVDVTSGYFWILWQRFTAQNMILLFYACALGVLLLLTVSMVYGRWWCGWICPQTLVSDFGDSLKFRIERAAIRLGISNNSISTAAWYLFMSATAIATTAVVLSYFYPPARVWFAVFHPLSDPRVELHLVIVASVIAADLLWVRRNFCRRGCPYGLMLSVIGDRNTMTVRYLWERDDDCISCGKCVTVCPMSIDIKDGPNQMECIGCGECIDACNDILPLITNDPKPGLIELRYGVDPMRKNSRLTILQRLGAWDTRRMFLAIVVIVLAGGLGFNMFGTRPTSVTVSPSGTITEAANFVFEKYDVNIFNGKPSDSHFALTATGKDRLMLFQSDRIVEISRSAQKTVRLTLEAPIASLVAGQRYPVNIIVRSLDKSHERNVIATFFYVPELPSRAKAAK